MTTLAEWFGSDTETVSPSDIVQAEGAGAIYSRNGAGLRREVGGLIASLMFSGATLEEVGGVMAAQCKAAARQVLEAAGGEVEACHAAYLEMDEPRERQICEAAKSPYVVAKRMVAVVTRLRLASRKERDRRSRVCPECCYPARLDDGYCPQCGHGGSDADDPADGD